MGKNTEIEWCDHTFNAWAGCSPVSTGCANCYAKTLNHRYKWVTWGKDGTRHKFSQSYWKNPLKWNEETWKECPSCGWRDCDALVMTIGRRDVCPHCEGELIDTKQRVFASSLSDVFEDRPDVLEWRYELFSLILSTPNLDWLVLTKRPENIKPFQDVFFQKWGDAFPDNVWLGTSVENQDAAIKRIPELLSAPAAKHFLSMEPLLGPVDLCFPDHANPHKDLVVIVGGESGPKARYMNPEWVRDIRDQCLIADVPFFFKQWGSYYKTLDADTHSKGELLGAGYYEHARNGGACLDGEHWRQMP